MTRKLLFLLFGACFFLRLCDNALAVTKNIDIKVTHGVLTTTCSNLKSNTQYVLAADITTNCYFPSDGINIVLDCNWHSINTSTDPFIATVILQGSNSVVTNCVITSGSGKSANGVEIIGTGNTLNNSSVTGNSVFNVSVSGNNHRITNNNISGGSQTDDNIIATTVDNLLIDNNTIQGNYDLTIEGLIYLTNSRISNNTLYVAGSGNAAIGGYYTNNLACCLLMSNTTIANNKIHGMPWYYFLTTTGSYRDSVDGDAQTALDNRNTFSGNASF